MAYSRRTVDLNNVARLWNIFAGLHICCLGGHVRRDQAPAAENVSGNCIKSLRDSWMPWRGSSVKQFTDSAAACDNVNYVHWDASGPRCQHRNERSRLDTI